MPTATARNEIHINGITFKIKGGVQQFIASGIPPKIVQGDFTLDTHPLVSTVTYEDLRGGIGKDIFDPREPDRVWFATEINLRNNGHSTLARRSIKTAAAASTDAVGFIGDFSNAIYAAFGTTVASYSNTDDAWTSKRTLLNSATDGLTDVVNGTLTLMIATGSEVDYTTDGSSWSRNTTDIAYLARWRELLWGIDNNGNTYFTDDLSGSWTQDSKLQLRANAIKKLFVGPSPDATIEADLLYCATTRGLAVYDAENSRWVWTKFRIPYHPNNGANTVAWREAIYYPADHGIYEINPAANTVIRVMGPDRDDGLPSARRTQIIAMAGAHNDLLIGTNSAAGGVDAESIFLGSDDVQQFGIVVGTNLGSPTVLGWAGGRPPVGIGGWEVKWASGTAGTEISSLFVSDAYTQYRAWWGNDGRVYYQDLPTDIVNPTQIGTAAYASSGVLDYPWIRVPGNQSGVALTAFLETRNPTSSETVALSYATNHVETFTSMGTNSSSERKAYNFTVGGVDQGVEFRELRFRASLARGSTDSNTPDILSLALAFRRPFTYLRGFRVLLDLTQAAGGRKPHELREELDTILATVTQMPFVYRNEQDSDEIFQVTVDPTNYGGQDRNTGVLTDGTHLLTLVEAI